MSAAHGQELPYACCLLYPFVWSLLVDRNRQEDLTRDAEKRVRSDKRFREAGVHSLPFADPNKFVSHASRV